MNNLLSNIKIEVPSGTYLKDPESSTLGKNTHSQYYFNR